MYVSFMKIVRKIIQLIEVNVILNQDEYIHLKFFLV